MRQARILAAGFAAILYACLFAAQAQAGARGWFEAETANHRIYYPAELSGFAHAVSDVIHNRLDRIAEAYDYRPGEKTGWVLKDEGETFNGAAFTLLNRIELIGTSSDFELRGLSNWVDNVVTHEYTHLATLAPAQRYPRWLGGWIFGGTEEFGRRPLTDSTKTNVKLGWDLFVPNGRVPRWFAEGIAQYEAERAGGDRFDSTRRMLERMAYLEQDLLSLVEMGSVADKNFLDAERVYNQGFSWVKFLAERGGADGFHTLLQKEADNVGSFHRALVQTYGVSITALEAAWRQRVAARVADARARRPVTTTPVSWHTRGMFVRRAALAPDGDRVAMIDDGSSEFPMDRLVLASRAAPTQQTTVTERVVDTPRWQADGRALIVGALREQGTRAERTYDILHVGRQGEHRWLTDGARARWPTPHPNGATIATAVRDRGGWTWATLPASGGTPVKQTRLPWSWQLRELTYAPDGSLWGILVHGDEADLAHIDPQSDTATILDWPGTHERAPTFAPDGALWFSSDRSGAFQIYTWKPPNGRITARTGVNGGALAAAPGTDAALITVYEHRSFELHRLPTTAPRRTLPQTAAVTTVVAWTNAPPPVLAPQQRARFRLARPLFFPELQYQFGDPAAGGVLLLGDELGHHQLQFEALLGRFTEFDLGYDYTGLAPQLHLDARWFQTKFDLDVGFGGLPLNLPVNLKLENANPHIRYRFRQHWTVLGEVGIDRIRVSQPAVNLTALGGRRLPFLRRSRGLEATALLQWDDVQPRARADIDFRGSVAAIAATTRLSRNVFGQFSDDFNAIERRRSDHQFTRLTGNAQWADGRGDWTWELAADVGWIDRDVEDVDEFFLGGNIFSLRRGEVRSFTNMPGYDDFSISGEKFMLYRAAVRYTAATDLGGIGPIQFDALVFELAAHAGNAWPHSTSFGDIFEGWLRGNIWADFVPRRGGLLTNEQGPIALDEQGNALRISNAPVEPGLLFDSSFDIRLKTILFDAVPWNSFIRVARAWNTRTTKLGPQLDAVLNDEVPDIRVIFGLGTGF